MTHSIFETIPQVAKRLNVSPSTIKKYYLLIESYNCYAFKRDEKERIIFGEYDLHLIHRLIEIKKLPKITLEEACKLLLEEEGLVTINSNITVMTQQNDVSKDLADLKTSLELQQQQIKHLTHLLESQQTLLSSSYLEQQREIEGRDKSVMTVIRELQEVKRMLATTQEKKPWWRFW